MEKINIAGYEFNNFGSNNYSNKMGLITSTDRPLEIVEKVKRKEPGFENIWLNPSAPCSASEFFGLLGTEDQYKQVYKKQKDAQIAEKMIDKFGWDDWPSREITQSYKNELLTNYKDWWEK